MLKSYAKVNLLLEVIRKRADSYHDLNTLFERISLHDEIRLDKRRDSLICLKTSSREIPADSSNLAYRAASLLKEAYNVKQGVTIFIKKRIPVGAGLGGGSGNAACVLMGLNKFWKLNLNAAKLAKLGAQIGSDVAFFIYDAPFALGEGRGERIKPLLGLKNRRLWHVLVVPRIHVSTPRIYSQWDKLKKDGKLQLTRRSGSVKLLTSALSAKGIGSVGNALFNSLEEVTTGLHPEILEIKKYLQSLGVEAVLMSGSGPAVFGIVSERKEAQSICRKLRRFNRSWRSYAVCTR